MEITIVYDWSAGPHNELWNYSADLKYLTEDTDAVSKESQYKWKKEKGGPFSQDIVYKCIGGWL